jgi:hypothetical protein
VAPHLVRQISSSGIETFGSEDDSSSVSSDLFATLPLLDDIVEIISLTIFNTGDADWSKLEQAKLKMIQTHGEAAAEASADLTTVDTHRASVIAKTIYDTVINIPSTNKATYTARAAASKSWSLWDYFGFGLIKSSDAVRNVKSLVAPVGICETTDTAYLKGAEEAVYYSSLTDGLAGGALAAAPNDSTVKRLGLGTIIASIGQLAIQIHMAQSIARLAEFDPADENTRVMILLALTADSPKSDAAQTARDIYSMTRREIANKIPSEAIKSLEEQASLNLITRGAGHGGGQTVFANIPVIRNIFAFSSEVLTANNLGDVLKYVFCPSEAVSEAIPAATPSQPVLPVPGQQSADDQKTQASLTEEEIKQKTDAVTTEDKKVDSKVPETAVDEDEVEIEEINEAANALPHVDQQEQQQPPTQQQEPQEEEQPQQQVFKVDEPEDEVTDANEFAGKVAKEAKFREEEFQRAAEAAARSNSDGEKRNEL